MLINFFKKLSSFLLRHKILALLLIVVLAVAIYFGRKAIFTTTTQPEYQTATVTKGTVVQTVSASGSVVTSKDLPVTTEASGVVSQVLVKDGDQVTQGQTIAQIQPDSTTQQKQAAAWSSYLQAQNSLNSANASLNTLQNTLFTANQKFINDAVARDLDTTDPTYIEENATWLAAEANYKNQQIVIEQAKTNLTSAWMSYQQISSTITAPASGVINDLTITPGALVTTSTSSNSSSGSTPTKIGSVTLQGPVQVQVDLSEIDAPNVKIGQKATLTLDAFPDKTFTGKIASIDTTGSVSSGVTTYPAIITLDDGADNIYPNMSASANIITDVKNNVLIVPNSAIVTNNNQTQVRVLQNGQVSLVDVQTGIASDSETEITSGLSEGQAVVVGALTTGTTTSSSTSIFGGSNRTFGGGERVIVGGRGG
ncbi:MAG: efflux RND transporter periplasmic adaptor subunit [Patescibacteria group bacterium]|nr:efflux RND transporter periplasmic adaptor subunit [Patescibacteria group bacterium]